MGRPGVQLKFVGVIRLSDWRVDTWKPMSQPATLPVSELTVSNPPVAGPFLTLQFIMDTSRFCLKTSHIRQSVDSYRSSAEDEYSTSPLRIITFKLNRKVEQVR